MRASAFACVCVFVVQLNVTGAQLSSGCRCRQLTQLAAYLIPSVALYVKQKQVEKPHNKRKLREVAVIVLLFKEQLGVSSQSGCI